MAAALVESMAELSLKEPEARAPSDSDCDGEASYTDIHKDIYKNIYIYIYVYIRKGFWALQGRLGQSNQD